MIITDLILIELQANGKNIQSLIGKKFAFVSWSLDWNSMFPIEICQNLASAGYVPHIIWDPYYANKEKQIEPDDILSGEWDDYIISWVEACKNWGNPLFIT